MVDMDQENGCVGPGVVYDSGMGMATRTKALGDDV